MIAQAKNYTGLAVAVLVFGGAYFYNMLPARSGRNVESQGALPFELKEVSKSSGVVFKHETYSVHPSLKRIEPWLSHWGASVSVVDVNNDGWPDIYFTNGKVGSKNALFLNNHDGTFTDAAEKVGIAGVNSPYPSSRALFFDMDNTGRKDLLLISFCPRLFRQGRDGTFSETPGHPFGCNKFYAAANVVDMDGDGRLDVIMNPHFEKDIIYTAPEPDFLMDSFSDSRNGGGQVYVFANKGGGKFELAPDAYGMQHQSWTHAISVYDFDWSGKPGVWFATDFSMDKFYRGTGANSFQDMSPGLIKNNFSRNGMAAEIADLDNDGKPVVFVSHIWMLGQKPAGNLLWKYQGEGRFEEVAATRGLNQCGWAWGAKFIDLGNSGHLDLVVGNGFISQNPKKDFWYPMSVLDAGNRSIPRNVNNWPVMGDVSLGGYLPACLFYFHDGNFHDIAASTEMKDDLSDERGVAAIDFLNNGSQSFVFANQGQAAKFYRVTASPENDWIGFKLTGTRSNRDAIGAKIKVFLEDGKIISRQLQPFNGYASQSDERLHFGLGRQAKVKTIEVDWPSGTKQNLPGDRYPLRAYHELKEPN